jgi:signal recognition particle GTPase
MTKKERQNYLIIGPSRRSRIAKGLGHLGRRGQQAPQKVREIQDNDEEDGQEQGRYGENFRRQSIGDDDFGRVRPTTLHLLKIPL